MLKSFDTILLLFGIILPHTLYTIAPFSLTTPLTAFFFIIYLLILFRLDKGSISIKSILLTMGLVLFGIVTAIYKGGVTRGAVLFLPIFSFLGYNFVRQKSFNFNILYILYIILVIYFIDIYYSKLPHLFFRPYFNEDAIVFERASSNGISMALNITLLCIAILHKVKEEPSRYLVPFSVINLLFVFIQQSRAGIAFAMLFLLVNLILKWPRLKFVVGIFALIGLSFNIDTLSNLLNLENEGRLFAVIEFFKLAENNLILGPGINQDFAGLGYTYNVFLDSWINYSIFPSLLLFIITFMNLFKGGIHFYLFPCLVYFFSEGVFFPEYWDSIIYFLIF